MHMAWPGWWSPGWCSSYDKQALPQNCAKSKSGSNANQLSKPGTLIRAVRVIWSYWDSAAAWKIKKKIQVQSVAPCVVQTPSCGWRVLGWWPCRSSDMCCSNIGRCSRTVWLHSAHLLSDKIFCQILSRQDLHSTLTPFAACSSWFGFLQKGNTLSLSETGARHSAQR